MPGLPLNQALLSNITLNSNVWTLTTGYTPIVDGNTHTMANVVFKIDNAVAFNNDVSNYCNVSIRLQDPEGYFTNIVIVSVPPLDNRIVISSQNPFTLVNSSNLTAKSTIGGTFLICNWMELT